MNKTYNGTKYVCNSATKSYTYEEITEIANIIGKKLGSLFTGYGVYRNINCIDFYFDKNGNNQETRYDIAGLKVFDNYSPVSKKINNKIYVFQCGGKWYTAEAMIKIGKKFFSINAGVYSCDGFQIWYHTKEIGFLLGGRFMYMDFDDLKDTEYSKIGDKL